MIFQELVWNDRKSHARKYLSIIHNYVIIKRSMMKHFRSTITISLLVLSLAFVGVSCQQQEEPTAQPANTTNTTQTGTLPTDTGATGSQPFTVDLLPADDTDQTLPLNDQVGAGALDDPEDTLATRDETDESPFDVEEIDDRDTISGSSDSATAGEREAFVDRMVTEFGTYTNKDRTPYQNLIGLENDVTQGMQAYLDRIIANGVDPDAPFFGRTTTVISQTVLEDRATDTRVLVVAERQDVVGASAAPVTYYVTYVVRLVEDQVGYLLDGIYEVASGQDPLQASDED